MIDRITLSSLHLAPRVLLGGVLADSALAWRDDTVANLPPEDHMRVPMLQRGVSFSFLQTLLREIRSLGRRT